MSNPTAKKLKMKSPEHIASPPSLPNFLGLAGLIPFGLAAVGTHSGIKVLIFYSFLGGTAYGAVILSFLGAIHWALAMQDDRHQYWYVWSITPALLGFASLLILDVELRIITLLPLFFLTWSVDRQAANNGLIPIWYMRLRTILTTGAMVSLAAMFFAC